MLAGIMIGIQLIIALKTYSNSYENVKNAHYLEFQVNKPYFYQASS